ncbi:unnamed protein product, partial [Mesorhabditis spiculigera]
MADLGIPVECHFELRWRKSHIMASIISDRPVADLKKWPQKLLEKDPATFTLMWLNNERWVRLNDEDTLMQAGFNAENVQDPAILGLAFDGEANPEIAPLSRPPPAPQPTRADEAARGN